MADINLEQLIKQLQKADMAKLSKSLKDVSSNATNAQKAAAKFLSLLKDGIKEQEALTSGLKAGYGDLIDSENKATEAANTRVQALALVKSAIDQQNSSNKQILVNLEKIKKQNEISQKAEKDKTIVLKKNIDLRNKDLETAKKLTPVLKEHNKIAAAGGGVSGILEGAGKAAVGTLELAAKGAKDLGGKVLNGLGLEGLAKDATAVAGTLAFLKTEAGGKIVNFVADNFKKLNLELSTVTSTFGKFTGGVIRGDNATKNLSGRIINLQRRNRMLGATIKAVTESMTSMVKSSRTFGILMGTNRKQNTAMVDGLTEMAFRFQKVGLGAESFGKAIDVIGNTYGRSDVIKKGKLLGAELVNIGRVTGQSADTIANDFAVAMGNLAAYSLPKAREEFKKLSAISAVTGVEMGTVMQIASQFDDIENTADAVGSLNAMMGGPYLNTLDLVNATESERIDMLKQMMTQSGETFNTMDRFKQKAIAQALGTDVQQASRLFTGNQEDIDSTASSIDKQGASYQQLSVAAKKSATSISEQMTATKESTFLMSKAFNATDKAMRNANLQMLKFGDAAREQIGNIATSVINKFNLSVNQLGRSVEKFKITGNLGDLLEGNKGTLVKLAAFGGKGAFLYEGFQQGLAESGTGKAQETPRLQGAQTAPPTAASGKEVAAAANQKNFFENFEKMIKTWDDAIKAAEQPKPINVTVKLDGDKVGAAATGLGAAR
mgnify:CR=1 FL=1